MRNTMHQLVRYKAFQKLTISYFLLVLLTVSLLSGVLFYLFSRSAVKEIDHNSKAMLSQITYASDVVYNQVMTIGNALLIQREIISFLNDTTEDKVNNYRIFQQMSQITSIYPYIHSIGIYRPSTGTTVDTAGLPFDSSLTALSSERYMEFYPRSLTIAGRNNDAPLQLLTFLLYPDFSFRTSDNPLIYINVEEKSILTTIRKISKADAASNVFVINNEGKVLSHTDSNLFLEDLSKEQYVQRILNQDKEENSFTANIHNKKHLVTYVKSEKMDWYFVSVSPYSGLISNIDQLRSVTLLVTAGIVLAGLLVSIFLTKNIYSPLSTLFEKIMPGTNVPASGSPFIDEYKIMAEVFHSLEERDKSMQFVISSSSRTIRELYLHSLLQGHPLEYSVPSELIRDIDEEVSGPYFCVLVFKINELEQTKGRIEAVQRPLLRFALGNITKEMLAHIGACDYLNIGENETAAILQCAKNQTPEELKPALRNIQSFLNRYFKATVSIGVGDISYGRKNIPSSYTSAQQYVKYRMIYGKESILDAVATRPHMMTALSYPSAYEKKLIDAVQSGKPEPIREAIGQFVEQISNGSINQVITYSIQLMLSLLKHFDYLQHVPDSNFNEYLVAVTEIESAEQLTEINGIFNRYCFNICALIEEKNLWMNAQKHNVIIEKVQNYIQEQYAQPNLSLELVSNIAGLSPSYLGKLFKGATRQSFSEYLNHTRLEKAKDLLASTHETAAKISESVGMYNITYFSTLFKKKYGLTPSAYREQEALKSPDSAGEGYTSDEQA
ncbi:helix-turn-helix domain-containing protein [Paenibacillus riograndensis]|uniref:Putative membrane protein n=3 Tax=Paenibacillus riograndensis TaxID=483937 RepID=A0A0E4CWX2_9BACL|nr:helix-turn-helix domain-containing protein [Paenibacillus riograndensis]CQR55751.1 putative membrane protein [Paenibacillus riograndensis SBR5]